MPADSEILAEAISLSRDAKDLITFMEHFDGVYRSLRATQNHPEVLEGIKCFLRGITWRGDAFTISDYDMAQSILLLVNKLDQNDTQVP